MHLCLQASQEQEESFELSQDTKNCEELFRFRIL